MRTCFKGLIIFTAVSLHLSHAHAGNCEKSVLEILNLKNNELKQTWAKIQEGNGISVIVDQKLISVATKTGHTVYTPKGKFELNDNGTCIYQGSDENYSQVFAKQFILPLAKAWHGTNPNELAKAKFSASRGQLKNAIGYCNSSENAIFREESQKVSEQLQQLGLDVSPSSRSSKPTSNGAAP